MPVHSVSVSLFALPPVTTDPAISSPPSVTARLRYHQPVRNAFLCRRPFSCFSFHLLLYTCTISPHLHLRVSLQSIDMKQQMLLSPIWDGHRIN